MAASFSNDTRRVAIRAAVGLAAPVLLATGLALMASPGLYLWLKAIHIVAVIGWVGGMLGVVYLFGWHAATGRGSPQAELLSAIEARIVQRLVNPAMVITWGVGLWLAWQGGWYSSAWLQAKFAIVIVLSGLHGWVVRAARRLAAGVGGQGVRFSVAANTAGGLLAIAAIILAVVKPM